MDCVAWEELLVRVTSSADHLYTSVLVPLCVTNAVGLPTVKV